MSTGETDRKQLQRRMQQEARALQKAGKSAQEIKAAMRELKRKAKGGAKRDLTSSSRKRARQWRSQFDKQPRGRGGENSVVSAEAKKLGRKHHLVIVPIFWKRKDEEMESVLGFATELKQKLVAYKLNVWIDQRKSLTPGQKFNYWEHVGVKLRAEVGPQEAKKGEVVLSKLTQPGEVATRWKGLKVTESADVRALVHKIKEEGGYEWLDVDAVPLPANIEGSGEGGKKELGHKEEKDEAQLPPGKLSVTESTGDSLEVNYLVE